MMMRRSGSPHGQLVDDLDCGWLHLDHHLLPAVVLAVAPAGGTVECQLGSRVVVQVYKVGAAVKEEVAVRLDRVVALAFAVDHNGCPPPCVGIVIVCHERK